MRSVLLLLISTPLLAQRSNPDAVEAGRQLFLGACSACHGASGQGGAGPSLVSGRMSRLPEARLFKSIKEGLPGTDMPPFKLPDAKIRQLAVFVRSLSAPAIESHVAGNAAAGKALFFGAAGCAKCHMVAGQGGVLGPDLSNAGVTRTLL